MVGTSYMIPIVYQPSQRPNFNMDYIGTKFRKIELFSEVSVNLFIGTVFIAVVILVLYFLKRFISRKKGSVEVQDATSEFPKPRFRKRDKMIFYGKKYLRKVKQLSQQDEGYRRTIRKRQKVMFNFGREYRR